MCLRGIVLAHEARMLTTRVRAVILDRPSEVEEFLREHGIPAVPIFRRAMTDVEFQSRVLSVVVDHRLDWLGLTFNRLLSREIILAMGGRIFNLHMSLLPAFPRFGAIEAAIQGRVRLAGVTVHLIDEGVDTGAILAQGTVPVGSTDDARRLGARLFRAALPLVLQVVRSIERREIVLDAERAPHWSRTDQPTTRSDHWPAVDSDLARFADDFCSKFVS